MVAMIEAWQARVRYSVGTTLLLHLAPGALITTAFLLAAPVVNRAGGSSYLTLLLCIPMVLVPFELGVVMVERKRLGCRWRPIIAPGGRSRASIAETLLSVTGLYLVSMAAVLLVRPSVTVIKRAFTSWLPGWAIVDGLPDDVSRSTLWLGLVFSGVVAPIVEALYFRGLRMSRIPVGGSWAPALNAGLFAIYHFFSPWSYVAIFAAFLPLVYYFRISGKLVPVIVTHCLFNSVGIVAALARLA